MTGRRDLTFRSAYSPEDTALTVTMDDVHRADMPPAVLFRAAVETTRSSVAISATDVAALRDALSDWLAALPAPPATNTPDGWIRLLEIGSKPGSPAYYRAQDPEGRIPAVYWVPSMFPEGDGWIEAGPDSAFTVADAELYARRLLEAAALAKAQAR